MKIKFSYSYLRNDAILNFIPQDFCVSKQFLEGESDKSFVGDSWAWFDWLFGGKYFKWSVWPWKYLNIFSFSSRILISANLSWGIKFS